MTTPPRSPAKRALSIGIDQYPLWPADRQLNGCVNDVKLIQEILAEQFGFPRENLVLVTNAEATQERILAELDALIAATQPDDIVVFHYAGHGSQVTDLNGDEPSGYDSTLVPHDSAGWQGQNRDITDDVLELKLAALGAKTSYITLLFDCCHSGSVTRDVQGPKSRSLPPDRRSKDELLAMLPPAPASDAKASGPSGWLPIADKYVMIAGCRDDETSYEYQTPGASGVVSHGALTYFLARELRQVTPGTTYRDVFERAAAQVNAYASTQHPQMEGKADREVLGVRDVEPMRFVRVLKREDETVTLAAGAAQGMTIGSTWAIHAQGAKEAGPSSLLGEVEVTSVGAITAECSVRREEVSGSIAADARAVELSHAHGDNRLKVRLTGDAETEAKLRSVLEPSRLLELTEDPDAVTGTLLPARDRVAPDDPVPTAGALRHPVWAFRSETGAFLMPLKKTEESADILKNLEGTARYRRALAFENSDPDSALRGKFDLLLMRRSDDGTLTEATPSEGGEIVFEQDEAIVFRIRSNHDRPVFISLVDFGVTGAVNLVLPWKEASSQRKLGPGIQFDYETSKDKLFYVRWPKAFPFVAGEDPAREGLGVETVKLFITEPEADFSILQQAATRGGTSRLGGLLNGVFQGHATRDLGRNEPADGDWTTVTRSLVIRRRSVQALSGDTKTVQLGQAKITAQGLTGTAQTHFGTKDREAAATLLGDELRQALSESGVDERQTVEITGARQVGPAGRSVGEQPAMEVELPAPPEGYGQLLLSTDELGVVSWHVAPPPIATRGAPAATTSRRYLVPQSVPTESAPAGRGLLSAVGKKVLKELVFPLIDPIIGEVGASFVNALETKRWPYRMRTFEPGDYATDRPRVLGQEDWSRLGSGRALLFIHGTFSRAHLAFCQLPVDYMTELHRRYGGRVFAFDHLTLSHDPKENIRHFFASIPDGTSLDLDIVCHSRGGLVSRMLVEQQAAFALAARRLRVGRVVFVGAPNAGTPLANAARMGDLVDVVTNVMDALPDNGITDVLAMVIGVVKQLAVGVLAGLDGLQSMDPEGAFARWMNAGPRSGETKYYAVASNATPVEPGLRRLLTTKGLNKIMAGTNDLVVPTDGVFKENGSGFFPITERLVLDGGDGTSHTKYFESERVRRQMLDWLGG
ncbi:MAG: caspase family protein [Cytophagaceae bacterium]|nr:caspase family protein [Gemmatimonadaceae bacterium]